MNPNFLALIKQMNEAAYEQEAALAVEESGAKIAYQQGFIAGVRRYKQMLTESGYELDTKYMGTTERGLFYFDCDKNCNLNLDELREALSDIEEVTETTEWDNFKKEYSDAVEAMKNKLFYESEKGRDLHFCKGWYKGLQQVDEYIEGLNRQREYLEQEKAKSLPFDD